MTGHSEAIYVCYCGLFEDRMGPRIRVGNIGYSDPINNTRSVFLNETTGIASLDRFIEVNKEAIMKFWKDTETELNYDSTSLYDEILANYAIK